MGIHPAGPERDSEREAPLTLPGLSLPGSRPRFGGEEDEQKHRQCRERNTGAPRKLGGPAEVLPAVEELSRRPVEPGREGDVRAPIPGTQHSLPYSRLPLAERSSGRIPAPEAHSRLGEKEQAPQPRRQMAALHTRGGGERGTRRVPGGEVQRSLQGCRAVCYRDPQPELRPNDQRR